MYKNRVRSILLLSVMASIIATASVFAAPNAGEWEARKGEAQAELDAAQAELTQLLLKAGQLEADMIAKGEEISQAKVELAQSQEIEKKQYADMKLRIKYMYEEGDATILEALANAKDFTEFINKTEYVTRVHTYDRKKLQEYIDTKEKVEKLKAMLENQQANMTAMLAAYEAQEEMLNHTLESKRAQIADFESRIHAAAEAAARQSRSLDLSAASGRSYGSDVQTDYIPAGSTASAQVVVNAAYSQLGVPYEYGGSTPFKGLDCSGLVKYAHSLAGIDLPRTSQAQGGGGMAVGSPEPGDVVCYGTHIGIYIGQGQMIHAPKPGDVVKISAVYGTPWYRRYW